MSIINKNPRVLVAMGLAAILALILGYWFLNNIMFGLGIPSPEKPVSVPLSARYCGGADGGVWIDCESAGTSSNEYICSVFEGNSGHLMAHYEYRLSGAAPDINTLNSLYSSFDGRAINLKDGRKLVPMPPTRPSSVPSTATWIMGDGVWIDCHKSDTASDLYFCAIYSDSTGVIRMKGIYKAITDSSIAKSEYSYYDGKDIHLYNRCMHLIEELDIGAHE